jgi:hypothetical protein
VNKAARIPPPLFRWHRASNARNRFDDLDEDAKMNVLRQTQDASQAEMNNVPRQTPPTTRAERGSEADVRPAPHAGRRKYAKKYEKESVLGGDTSTETSAASRGTARASEKSGALATERTEPVVAEVLYDGSQALRYECRKVNDEPPGEILTKYDLDQEDDVTDAGEDSLERAFRTDWVACDDAALGRLLAEDTETDDEGNAGDQPVGMSADEALAALLRVFPGSELVDVALVSDALFELPIVPCALCGTPVVPAPASIRHGWRTVCPECPTAAYHSRALTTS